MRAILAALLLLAAGAAMGNTVQAANASDCATSAMGAIETNPLGAPVACVGGFILAKHCDSLVEPDRTECLHAVAAVKWGATSANLLMLAGASSIAWPVGIATAAVLWRRGAEEREFAHLCHVHEELAGHPMHCNYTPAPN